MVLSLLSRHPDTSFTLSEICERLNLNVATAHALLNALAGAQFLVREPATKRYSLGPALVRIGAAAAGSRVAVTDSARAHMGRLADSLGRQCVASTVIGGEIVLLAKAGYPGPLGLTMDVGQRLAYLPPFGTVFAAWGDESTIHDWIARIAAPATSDIARRCQQALSAVRAHGFSVGMPIDAPLEDRIWAPAEIGGAATEGPDPAFTELLLNEYFVNVIQPGERYRIGNISAPVFGADGEVVLALAIPFFNETLTGREIADFARKLTDAAREVTASVGGSVPGGPAPCPPADRRPADRPSADRAPAGHPATPTETEEVPR